jgi:hypothetical protein
VRSDDFRGHGKWRQLRRLRRLNGTMKHDETLDQYLQSLSDILFPQRAGEPGPVTIHSRGSDGDTPLHIASFAGNRHAVALLLEAGADVNAKGDLSTSPLYCAVSAQQAQVVELLLRYGADPDAENELGYTPRTLAEQKDETLPGEPVTGRGTAQGRDHHRCSEKNIDARLPTPRHENGRVDMASPMCGREPHCA